MVLVVEGDVDLQCLGSFTCKSVYLSASDLFLFRLEELYAPKTAPFLRGRDNILMKDCSLKRASLVEALATEKPIRGLEFS